MKKELLSSNNNSPELSFCLWYKIILTCRIYVNADKGKKWLDIQYSGIINSQNGYNADHE